MGINISDENLRTQEIIVSFKNIGLTIYNIQLSIIIEYKHA